jgi:hypothetical protein
MISCMDPLCTTSSPLNALLVRCSLFVSSTCLIQTEFQEVTHFFDICVAFVWLLICALCLSISTLIGMAMVFLVLGISKETHWLYIWCGIVLQCFKSQKVVSEVSAVHSSVLCWFFLHVSFCEVFSLASFLLVEVTIIILLDFLWIGDRPMRKHSDLKTCQLLDPLSVIWNEKIVDGNCICCNSNVVGKRLSLF